MRHFLDWTDRHPRFMHIYRYAILIMDFAGFCLNVWFHEIQLIALYCVFLALALWAVHDKGDNGDDDEDEENDDPDSPTGDAVDLWLKSLRRVVSGR